MNVIVLCFNKDGKVMFQRSGSDPSSIRYTSTEAIFNPSPSRVFEINNVVLLTDDYFLITIFTLPIEVKFNSNQKTTIVTYNCMGNKLSTNKGFTALDNAGASLPVRLNTYTNDVLGSPVSPLDSWKFDLSLNSFI